MTPKLKHSNRITYATVVQSPGRAVTTPLQPPDTTPGLSGNDTSQYSAPIVDQNQSLQPNETNSSLQTHLIVTPLTSVNLDDRTHTLPVMKMQGKGLRDKKANVRLEGYHLSPDGEQLQVTVETQNSLMKKVGKVFKIRTQSTE